MMGDVIELTVVVKDLDAAVERYGRLYGLREHHRLESKEFGFKSAILPLGAGHIELLQPTDPDKPAGRFLAKNGEFPVKLLRIGRRYVVPIPALMALLEG